MDSEGMKNSAKQFAINVGVLTQGLPVSLINRAYCNQIIRSGRVRLMQITEHREELNQMLIL